MATMRAVIHVPSLWLISILLGSIITVLALATVVIPMFVIARRSSVLFKVLHLKEMTSFFLSSLILIINKYINANFILKNQKITNL